MSFVLFLPSQRESGESSVLPSSELLLSGSKKHPQHQKGDSSVKLTLGMRLLGLSPGPTYAFEVLEDRVLG